MAFKRGSYNGAVHHRGKIGNYRVPVVSLLVISVLAPLLFLAARVGNFKPVTGHGNGFHQRSGMIGDWRQMSAVDQIEDLFPKEVIEVVTANIDDSGPLSLNVVGRKDLSSSWVWEMPADVSQGKRTFNQRQRTSDDEQEIVSGQSDITSQEDIEQNSKEQRKNSFEQGTISNDEHLVMNFQGVEAGAEHQDVRNNVIVRKVKSGLQE